MNRLNLSLLENAINFAEDALSNVVVAEEAPPRWKFAILSLVQAIELSLKELLRRQHPYLINANVDNPDKTVTIEQASTGCTATKLTSEQAANANYGEYPNNYEQLANDHFARSLLAPYSAQFRIGAPTEGFSTKAPFAGGCVDIFGYIVEVGINAKNRFGGYVGEKQYRLKITD